MHSECFEVWQNNLLSQLNKTKEGQKKLRNWSEKQKLQNLWKQQGYNLVIDACHCKCGEGSLRKDLNWVPPKPTGSGGLTGQWIKAVIQAQILLNICNQDQTVTAKSRREGGRRAIRTASRPSLLASRLSSTAYRYLGFNELQQRRQKMRNLFFLFPKVVKRSDVQGIPSRQRTNSMSSSNSGSSSWGSSGGSPANSPPGSDNKLPPRQISMRDRSR